MLDNAAPPAEAHRQSPRDDSEIRAHTKAVSRPEADMEYGSSPSKEELLVRSEAIRASSPLADTRPRRESSDDDIPLLTRASVRKSARDSSSNMTIAPRDRRPIGDTVLESPKQPVKYFRKPKAWAPKPISKNDMAAKMEVIRELETLWGKNFIQSFIPKCHRPLVKRRKGSKRSMFRHHESDPRNWLPSVLKAMLMIAKLTCDKAWLKKAIGEVVRYRIRHTGNRKPQLVTTDFDVIEDMYVRGWTVDASFEIRYKHLLMAHPKGKLETDEDIEHILQTGSGPDDPSDDNEDGLGQGDDDEETKDIVNPGANEDEIDNEMCQGHSAKTSNGIQGPPHHPLQQSQHPKSSEPQKSPKQSPQTEQPKVFGYSMPFPGYGPYMNSRYGGPMNGYVGPMTGYSPINSWYPGMPYGPYGGYDQHCPGKNSRSPDQQGQTQPGLPSMPPFPFPHHPMPPPGFPETNAADANQQSRFSPFGKRGRGYMPEPSPTGAISHLGLQSSIPRSPSDDVRARIKRELTADDHAIFIEDDEAPTNDLDGEPKTGDLDEEELQARAALAKAEHKRAILRVQLAQQRKKYKNRHVDS